MSSFGRGLVIQWPVVGALLIREIYSRFGRDSLGFAYEMIRAGGSSGRRLRLSRPRIYDICPRSLNPVRVMADA
jgi:hypothetical protein